MNGTLFSVSICIDQAFIFLIFIYALFHIQRRKVLCSVHIYLTRAEQPHFNYIIFCSHGIICLPIYIFLFLVCLRLLFIIVFLLKMGRDFLFSNL